jgi:hypothetical protein
MDKTTSSSTGAVTALRWVARIFGTFLAAIFLFFFIAEFITDVGSHHSDAGHLAVIILFLLGQFGILIAWRWEGIGGMLAAIGVVLCFLINLLWVHAEKNPGFVLIWLLPAFLFLYCWWQTRKRVQPDVIEKRS